VAGVRFRARDASAAREKPPVFARVEALTRLPYALAASEPGGRSAPREPDPWRRAPNSTRADSEAFSGATGAESESNAANTASYRKTGELMGRTRVAALIVLATLLVSGAPDERAEPAVAAAGPLAVPAQSEFDEAQLMRFLDQAAVGLSAIQIQQIAAAVIRYSDKYGLDPVLVTQILWVESGARPWVRSPLGAVGLMQVMPHMADQLDLAGNLATIDTNIEAGCWILADNIRRLGEEDGISAYFWGSDIRSVVYLDRVRKARATVRGASES